MLKLSDYILKQIINFLNNPCVCIALDKYYSTSLAKLVSLEKWGSLDI